jgi:hypothetical protein
MIRKRIKNRLKGFSIVEICVVVAILTVFLIPVFTLMTRGSSGTIRNRNEILAQQYASNYIAYCNVVPFDNEKIAEVNEKVVNELNIELKDGSSVNIDKTEDNFKRIVSIKDYPDTSDRPYKYKIVSVKIEWQQVGEKKKRDLVMSGLVTER